MSEVIVEYEKSPQQKAAEKIVEIKQRSAEEIARIKQQSNEEIAQVRENLRQELSGGKKEAKRVHREAKRAEYVNRTTRYSIGEEIFHAISHGVGVGLSIAATVLLIVHAVLRSSPELKPFFVTGVSIFGASLVFTYVFSTLYHALTPLGAKKIFAIFDHSSIYVLIAGTYTPLCLGSLHNALGWTYFGIIWGLALVGVALYAVYGSRMRVLSAVTYLLMGWMIIFAIKWVKAAVPTSSLVFLLVGGAAYTIGFLGFYIRKETKWTHSVWHLFSLAGSILHFFAIYFSI